MYRDDEANQFLEVTYQNGDKEIMYFKDFSSGAMIENIVRRAKKLAIKRLIASGNPGIRVDDLIESIHQEYKEHEDLPNTTNPDDWAKISGKKGERIVYVRTLIKKPDADDHRAVARSSGSPPASTSSAVPGRRPVGQTACHARRRHAAPRPLRLEPVGARRTSPRSSTASSEDPARVPARTRMPRSRPAMAAYVDDAVD